MPSSSAPAWPRSRATASSTPCCSRAASIPGSPNRLDDLCARYGIDNSRRIKHGALLDAEILAEVYLELIGGRQAQLILVETGNDSAAAGSGRAAVIRPRPIALPARLTEEDLAAHAGFRASLGDKAIWADYVPAGS